MALAAGAHLGPYEIVSLLGAGGMGEVYKASDTRLDRTVAIKILQSADPHQQQRFEREARAISALDHPHICALYDVQQASGQHFLVMQYVEGETLADRLTRGALPLAQALRYAIEIADALAHAHRHGIVHRDLKPANVMLTKTDARLLDFGVAKLCLTAAASDAVTRTQGLTTPGMVVGTLHDLAPEQIDGRATDARTDVFSFGLLLFEMLTGHRAFERDSQAAVIAAMRDDSPKALSTVLPHAPAMLEYIVQRCLVREPDDRWQSARDVMFALEGLDTAVATMAAEPSPRPLRTAWLAWGLVVVLAAAFVTTLTWRTSSSLRAGHVSRLSIPPPDHTTFIGGYAAPHFALSPEGRRLAFVPTPIGGRTLLWIRDLDSLTARALTGTDGATYPFWSPDGRSLGFFADGKLKTMDSAGGIPQAIADAPDARGGAWGDGVIVYAPQLDGPLYRVSSGGGQPSAVTTLDRSRQEASHRLPSFLPDGRQFLYLIQSGRPENSAVYIASVDSALTHALNVRASKAIYAAGFLVFGRERSLMAQPFDPGSRQLSGEPIALGDQVTFRSAIYGDGLFSVAGDGTLASARTD